MTGFYLPGDLTGLEAICAGRHVCDALTLETTRVCEIPFERLEGLIVVIPMLGQRLMRILSRRIGSDAEPVSYTHLDVYKRQPITCMTPRLRRR